MFNKLFRRNAKTNSTAHSEQHALDMLRLHNADLPFMQLHCDRMQIVLDATL